MGCFFLISGQRPVLLAQFLDSFFDPLAGVLHKGVGAGHVQPTEAGAGLTEPGAHIGGDAHLFGKPFAQLFLGHAQAAAIQPHQIGGFVHAHFQFGAVLVDEVHKVLAVVPKHIDQLIQPLLAFVVGGDGGRAGEDVGAGMGLGHLSLELLPHFLVGNQDIGALDAGQVEGLTGGGADDTVHLGVLGHIAVDDVLAGEDQIVVEASSIGYEIHVPLSFLEELPPVGEEVRIYTYLQVKEDALNLFGFRSRQDLKMFKQLLGVNGIGPKGALGLLSAMRPDDLRLAVISGDAKAISKAPGIGLKTAQRLILDLKDKISVEEILMTDQEETGTTPVRTGGLPDAGKEAVDALTALGYSAMEATKAVRQVEITGQMTAEDVLKASLRHLSFF